MLMKQSPLGFRSRLAATLAVILGLPALIPLPAHAAEDRSWSISQPHPSPHGLTATVSLDGATGTLSLTVLRGGTTVLEPAPVGLVTDSADLSSGLHPQGRADRRVREKYTALTGKRRDRDTLMNETRLSFTGARERRLDLVVRVSGEGVAYRYALPEAKREAVRGEASAFQLPEGATAWLTRYEASHEQPHTRSAASAAPTGSFGYPALYQVGNSYVLLSESGVDGRYSGSRLNHRSGSGRYTVALADPEVRIDGPSATPWRTAVIGSLARVTGSTLTDDLAPPSRVEDTSWIRPGTVAWSWLAGGRPAQRNLETQQTFVDYSAAHGWPYTLVDEGWATETWMPELVDYAASRGVGVLAWLRWTDLDTPAEREATLTRMNEWGVSGLKIDFIGSEAQERQRWYDDVLAATAAHKLLVTFHGSTVPNGMQRTWPHVMTLEAVRGAEYRNVSIGDMTTLPFTRNVVGSMDYTPMAFHRGGRALSDAGELALAVVYESGFQHFAGSLDAYRKRPEAERFLEQTPTVWDDTGLVSGRPGEAATFARRSGDRWFLGSIAAGGGHEQRVPLRFLGTGRWLVETVRDGADGLVREARRARRGDTLTVPVPAHGGFAAVACPARPGVTSCYRPVHRVPPSTLAVTPRSPSGSTAPTGASPRRWASTTR